MSDSCPNCGGPHTWRRELDSSVEFECQKCGGLMLSPLALVFPEGLTPPEVFVLFSWTRPFTPRERLAQELGRVDAMKKANERRGQRLPADVARYRDQLSVRLEGMAEEP